jgi:hypothetical protein
MVTSRDTSFRGKSVSLNAVRWDHCRFRHKRRPSPDRAVSDAHKIVVIADLAALQRDFGRAARVAMGEADGGAGGLGDGVAKRQGDDAELREGVT